MLNVPGVTGNGYPTGPGGLTDSVDCDDGALDGSGTQGRSYFGSGGPGLTFAFTAPFPQLAGLVRTDGVHNTSANSIHFEASAPDGTRLGQVDGGHADTSQVGGTAEDRFYGVLNEAGVQRIRIWQTSGCCGIEIDHLQFGPIVPACDPDLNQDGNVDQDDVIALINTVGGGGCPSVLLSIQRGVALVATVRPCHRGGGPRGLVGALEYRGSASSPSHAGVLLRQ